MCAKYQEQLKTKEIHTHPESPGAMAPKLLKNYQKAHHPHINYIRNNNQLLVSLVYTKILDMCS